MLVGIIYKIKSETLCKVKPFSPETAHLTPSNPAIPNSPGRAALPPPPSPPPPALCSLHSLKADASL